MRLDLLNVGHLPEMFDATADENEVIAAENEAHREQIARCKPSWVENFTSGSANMASASTAPPIAPTTCAGM